VANDRVYNKDFDFIRMELLCHLFPDVIYDSKTFGIKLAFGGASVVFVREIPMWRKYNLHARITSWSPRGKWLYVQGVFTLPPSKTSKFSANPRQLPTMINNLNADPGMVSGTSTPTSSAPNSLSVRSTIPTTTATGEVICAVIYGRYVFKRRSRETVPIPEVLGICGYTGDEEIEKKRLEGWEYVKGLEHDWDRERALQSARDV
jgi:hypothetical protein